ncbi:MAG TPA: hypothetical protein VJ783_04875 [Pirellulales bacterium]|nr:hypothetical protein [Pirellulales bacterium]
MALTVEKFKKDLIMDARSYAGNEQSAVPDRRRAKLTEKLVTEK